MYSDYDFGIQRFLRFVQFTKIMDFSHEYIGEPWRLFRAVRMSYEK